MADLV